MRCVFDALNGLLITSSSSMIRPTCLNCVHLLSVDCTLLLLLSALLISCAVQLILLLYKLQALSIWSHRRSAFVSRVPTDSSRTSFAELPVSDRCALATISWWRPDRLLDSWELW